MLECNCHVGYKRNMEHVSMPRGNFEGEMFILYWNKEPSMGDGVSHKVETPYHDNDLILNPIISPQSG